MEQQIASGDEAVQEARIEVLLFGGFQRDAEFALYFSLSGYDVAFAHDPSMSVRTGETVTVSTLLVQ